MFFAYLCSFMLIYAHSLGGDALLYGVTSFIANYLITLPQACKPVFLLFSPQKGGRKTTHCKLTKRTVQRAVVVAIKLTKSRIFGCLVSENTGETLLSTYKKSHFWVFGLRKHGGNTFKYLQKVAFLVVCGCKGAKRGTIVFDRGVTGGAKM